MRKPTRPETEREMLDEYGFSRAERGKYAKRYAEGTNLVILSPDLTKFFPNSESVNRALRDYLKMVNQTSKRAAS